jgi:hypothetical protein
VVDAPGTYGARATDPKDPWGPATSVRSASAAEPAPGRRGHTHSRGNANNGTRTSDLAAAADPNQGYWGRRTDARDFDEPVTNGGRSATAADRYAPARDLPRYGVASWLALGVMVIGTGVGVVIDVTGGGSTVRGGLNIAIIIASVLAILIVRKRGMFPIVIAPPIVYSIGEGIVLYIRSDGLHDSRDRFDVAANWLVYGFPAMAAATAAVLIIAGLRMIIRR